jgi:hypothetical protein
MRHTKACTDNLQGRTYACRVSSTAGFAMCRPRRNRIRVLPTRSFHLRANLVLSAARLMVIHDLFQLTLLAHLFIRTFQLI